MDISEVDFAQLSAMYEDGRFLDVYEYTEDLWRQPELIEKLDGWQLVLAGRVAFRLGGDKYGRWLFREANKRFPCDPDVVYYTSHRNQKFRNIYDYLCYLDSVEFDFSKRNDLAAYMEARKGGMWARVRDFKRARRCLDKAFGLAPDDYWINVSKSYTLIDEDCLDDALGYAQKAYALAKCLPSVIDCLSQVLCRMERFDEAEALLCSCVESTQSHEIALSASSIIMQQMRRQGGDITERNRRMQQIDSRMESLMPLADRSARVAVARVRTGWALSCRDFGRARQYSAGAASYFYNYVLDYEKEHLDGKRFVLPHRAVRQKWQTCAPSSIATALSVYGEDVDEDQMAAIHTYGGTNMSTIGHYLSEHGCQVIPFLFSVGIARQLLESGYPFVYTESYEGSGHALCAVGLDNSLGLLLLHDPSQDGLREVIIERTAEDDFPIGPFCMLIIPDGEPVPQIDRLSVTVASIYYDFNRYTTENGYGGSEQLLQELRGVAPEHPVLRYLEAELYTHTNRPYDALQISRELFEKFRSCYSIRRLLLNTCAFLENTALKRETLRLITLERKLSDEQDEPIINRVGAGYLCQYADCLRMNHSTHSQSLNILRQALRYDPLDAYVYHVLSDLLLDMGQKHKQHLPSRIACCLDPTNDHYAYSYYNTLYREYDYSVAIDWLHDRAQEFGTHPRGAGAMTLYIDELENSGDIDKALEQMHQALKDFPDEEHRLNYACALFIRCGIMEEAFVCLQKLEKLGKKWMYYPVAVQYYFNNTEYLKALEICESWVQDEPGNHNAEWEYLRLLRHAKGIEAPLAKAREWIKEYPANEVYEEMLMHCLNMLADDEAEIECLYERVKRNPFDGVAWRKIGFSASSDAIYSIGKEKKKHVCRAREALDKCEQIVPGWPVCIIQARLAEADGDTDIAIDYLFKALDDSPNYPHAYDSIANLCQNYPLQKQEEFFERILDYCLRYEIGHDFDFVQRAAERLGVAKALHMVDVLEQNLARKSEVMELKARLLAYNARGTDSNEIPEAVPDKLEVFLRCCMEEYPAYQSFGIMLAEIYLRLEREDEAIEILRKFEQNFPMNMRTRGMLADALEHKGELEEAKKQNSKLIDLYPFNSEGYGRLSRFYFRLGNDDAGLDILEAGVKKMPRDIGLRERLIDLQADAGNFSRAVELGVEGTEVYPDGAYLWYMLGDIQYRADTASEDAVASLKKSLTLNPYLFRTADKLAQIHLDHKRYDEALCLIEPFCDSPQYEAEAKVRKCWIERNRGNVDIAYNMIEGVLESTPGMAWAWRSVAWWIMEDKCYERAKSFLGAVPPVMQTDDEFRSRRLELLKCADVDPQTLEHEWETLLRDFPDGVYLYLTRFDDLYAKDKTREKAVEILAHIKNRHKGNPYIIARDIEIQLDNNQLQHVLPVIHDLWQMHITDNNWPHYRAWELLVEKGHVNAAIELISDMLGKSEDVASAAIYQYVLYFSGSPKKEQLLNNLMLLGHKAKFGSKQKQILRILLNKMISRPYPEACLEACLDGMKESSMKGLILEFFNGIKNTEAINASALGKIANSYVRMGKWKKVPEVLVDWQKSPGGAMWIGATYITGLYYSKAVSRKKLPDYCEELLLKYPHDHTAWQLVQLELLCLLQSVEVDRFLEVASRYKDYSFRQNTSEEWSLFNQKYYCAFKEFIDLCDARDRTQAVNTVNRLALSCCEGTGDASCDVYPDVFKNAVQKVFERNGWGRYSRTGFLRSVFKSLTPSRILFVIIIIGWLIRTISKLL